MVRIQNAARGRGSPRPGGGAAHDGRPPAERIGLLRPPRRPGGRASAAQPRWLCDPQASRLFPFWGNTRRAGVMQALGAEGGIGPGHLCRARAGVLPRPRPLGPGWPRGASVPPAAGGEVGPTAAPAGPYPEGAGGSRACPPQVRPAVTHPLPSDSRSSAPPAGPAGRVNVSHLLDSETHPAPSASRLPSRSTQ